MSFAQAQRLRRLAGDWRFLAFLANFGLGKGIAFVGPIIMGLTLGPRLYGALEFGLALAPLVAMIASAGVPQAVMQLVLMRSGRKVDDLLLAGTCGLAALGLCGALALTAFDAEPRWRIASAVIALCAAQQAGVAFARAHGLPNLNVWIDHAPTVIVVIVALALGAFGGGEDARAAATILTILAALVFCTAAAGWRMRQGPRLAERLREAIGIGFPILVTSLVGVWIVASGRVYMGLYLDDEDTHAFAFTFRFASLLVLLHAVIATAFATRLYKMPTRRFDPFAASLVLAVAALAATFIVVAPERHAARWFSNAASHALESRSATAVVPAQVFFWIAAAIVEARIARARAAWSAAKWGLATALAFAIAIYAIHRAGALDFPRLVIALALQQVAMCAVLHAALTRRRLPLRRVGLATILGGALVGAATAYVLLR